MPKTIPAQKQVRQPGRQGEMNPSPETIREDYRGSGKLEQKVALVTGGDSGIGRAVAVHFAREGADVAIVYLEENKDAEETKKLVEGEGTRCLLIQGDVSDSGFCRRAVENTITEFGKLNVLVNNAARQEVCEDLRETTDEQWERTFQTNIHGYFYMARAALRHLREGDSIINVTSVNPFVGNKSLVDYTSTKGAVNGFTRSLSEQVVGRGLRVNQVAPGPIWTPLIPATMGKDDPDSVEGFGSSTPMGRAGQPSDLGPAFVFLACRDSSYMSGQTIHLNGGKVLNG
jgi:NAD(P)-dependent dehydrogenase (short-subunit alcohol dehydrogenase family)